MNLESKNTESSQSHQKKERQGRPRKKLKVLIPHLPQRTGCRQDNDIKLVNNGSRGNGSLELVTNTTSQIQGPHSHQTGIQEVYGLGKVYKFVYVDIHLV